MKQVKAVIMLSDGFEEVEAITPIDYLRRADVEVILAGVGTKTPVGAQNLKVVADVGVEDLPEKLDAVILPGGMPGAENLSQSSTVENLCKTIMQKGGLVAAICAAPAVVLGRFGLLKNRRYTCYPGYEEQVNDGSFSTDRVVIDGNLITSRSPGCAGEFSIELIRYLVGDAAADLVGRNVLLKPV